VGGGVIALGVGGCTVLACVSILLAVVEASFYNLKRRRLGHVAMQNPRAELASRYLDDPPTLLMPVHLGTYTAHVGMTAILTWLFLDVHERWAVLAAVAVMVVYLLVFRLTLPYALVKTNPERTLLMLLPAFHLYARALSPLVRALRRPGSEDDPEDTAPPRLTPGIPTPPVHEYDEVQLVDSLDRFSNTQVREVMTPRPDVEAVAADESLVELRRVMRESKYSRIPVFGENLDDIVGIVTVRDLLEHEESSETRVRDLTHPVFLVPETKRVAELLRELQAKQVTLAVVIDEYGGTAGVVSVEDIVEEIVGEIKDEYDEEIEPITVEQDGSVLVAGRVSVERLEQYLDARLGEDGEVETAGGLATAAFGRVPRVGERTALGEFEIEVVEAERKRVNRLRIRRSQQAAEP